MNTEIRKAAVKCGIQDQNRDAVSVYAVFDNRKRQAYIKRQSLNTEQLLDKLNELAKLGPEYIEVLLSRNYIEHGPHTLKKATIPMNTADSNLNGMNYSQPEPSRPEPSPAITGVSYEDYRVRQLQKDLEEERAKRKKAEDKADELKEKNHELRIENATKDRENQLEVQAKEAEHKDGLSGLMDDPETKQAVIGALERLGSNFIGNGQQQQQQLASPSREPEPEDNSDLSEVKQQVLQAVRDNLTNYEDLTARKLAALAPRPDLINKAYDQAAQQQQKQQNNGQQ